MAKSVYNYAVVASQRAKSPKEQSVGVYFLPHGTVFWVPN